MAVLCFHERSKPENFDWDKGKPWQKEEISFNTFSVSTSATCWLYPHLWGVGALGQPLHSSFCFCWGGRATQTVQSHWGERQLHATLPPAHSGCCWELSAAPLIFDHSRHESTLYVHPNPSPSQRLSSVCAHLHLLTCVCESLTTVFALFSWTVSCKEIGLDTLLFFYLFIALSTLSLFSVCHLFPCEMEQKLSLEWLDITLLTLCPPPFLLSLLKKKSFSVRAFIYLLISISFWVI